MVFVLLIGLVGKCFFFEMFQLDEASGEGYSSAHILGQHGFLENIV